MTFWLILIVLCLLAVGFAVWPLWRNSHRLTPLVATLVVFTVAFSAGLYDYIGSPGVPSGRSVTAGDGLPNMDEAIVTLQKRLEQNPEDIAGWKMLARTQATMRDYAGAVTTYEKVLELEDAKVAQTMVDLAIAISNRDQTGIAGRTASLLESALALEPNNPAALFYSGVAAADRGDTDTAAERWKILLGLNPPENIRGILEQRIAEWTGEAAPTAPPVEAASEDVASDAIVAARVSLSDEAAGAITQNANVFIIARDPAAPSPPIAVVRRSLSDLPAMVSLTDANSMVAGRNLSMFPEIEVLARVSLSGGPAAASGDWFGSLIMRPAENNSINLTIDQQVP